MRIFPNEEHNALLLETKEETSPQYICHYCKVSSLIKKIPVDCEPEEVEIFVRSPKKAFTFRIPLEEISDSKVFLQYCYNAILNIELHCSKYCKKIIIFYYVERGER